MAASTTDPLRCLDGRITRRHGTFYEAEIFLTLLDYPFVFRSFEFAPVDGALLATASSLPPSGNYTDRFWQLNEQVRSLRGSSEHQARTLIPFDIKSCSLNQAEHQVYITNVGQLSKTGFYIAVCAANPSYVEIIPNRSSGPSPHKLHARKVALNESRKSMLPPSAYGYLSPCNSSYRMPLSLLPKALESLRQCAQGDGDYTNPWTGVQFPGWKPYTEHDNEILTPREDSQHYSSFIGILELWRGFRVARSQRAVDIQFEFVNLQPQLADFKLVVPGTHEPSPRRQLFVQYKIDGLYRSPTSPLTKVAIARNQRKGKISYYFHDMERFDYLLYQFQYVDQQKQASIKFFFLPERIIPDEFYTTSSKQGDFSRDEFRPYWIELDVAGAWVHKVMGIIQKTPHPRKSGNRPRRPLESPNESPSSSSHKVNPPQPILHHVELLHRKLFYTLMTKCAHQLSGLVVVLSRAHPMGDFAYCRYNWTLQEQDAFFLHQTVPCTITSLPSSTSMTTFSLHTRSRETTTRGPSLTASEIHRLNLCAQDRLLVFDVFGHDGFGLYSPLLAVPSADIRPTPEQFALYRDNRSKDKEEEFEGRVPLLSELLSTGLTPIDYSISTGGPLVFEDNIDPWGQLWKLLEDIAGLGDFEYPPDSKLKRECSDHQVSLQQLHQCLIDQHALTEETLVLSDNDDDPDDDDNIEEE